MSDWWDGFFIALVIIILVASVAFPVASLFVNMITVDAAIQRFSELSELPVGLIEVVRHSNNSPFMGNTHDVTFELLIGGKPASGRCTSAVFSPMVCRLYEGE